MAVALEAMLQIYFKNVLYVGTASNDVTTNLVRRIGQLTHPEITARVKAIIVAAGTSN